ncbi:hypothetical protein X975_12686, partial [Stegodyphus mimosarum]
MTAVQEKMEAGQESIKEETKAVQKKIEAGQEEMKREVTCIIENKFEAMNGRIDAVKNKIGQIEEKVSPIEQQISYRVSAVTKEVDTLKKQQEAILMVLNFYPCLLVPSLNLSTCDDKTSWQVYKTQFSVVADANG